MSGLDCRFGKSDTVPASRQRSKPDVAALAQLIRNDRAIHPMAARIGDRLQKTRAHEFVTPRDSPFNFHLDVKPFGLVRIVSLTSYKFNALPAQLRLRKQPVAPCAGFITRSRDERLQMLD